MEQGSENDFKVGMWPHSVGFVVGCTKQIQINRPLQAWKMSGTSIIKLTILDLPGMEQLRELLRELMEAFGTLLCRRNGNMVVKHMRIVKNISGQPPRRLTFDL